MEQNITLILASGSPYRRELLERLGVPFRSWSPEVDEAALPGEAPRQTAARLARLKAEAGGERFPDAWVIGSDQVAEVDGRPVNKPGSLENARRQLAQLSGREVRFHTGLCLWNAPVGRARERLVTTEVRFRKLDAGEIERYLAREPAIDCAGSAKSEGLGISLLERLGGDDPTALVGLPLIELCRLLRDEGLQIP